MCRFVEIIVALAVKSDVKARFVGDIQQMPQDIQASLMQAIANVFSGLKDLPVSPLSPSANKMMKESDQDALVAENNTLKVLISKYEKQLATKDSSAADAILHNLINQTQTHLEQQQARNLLLDASLQASKTTCADQARKLALLETNKTMYLETITELETCRAQAEESLKLQETVDNLKRKLEDAGQDRLIVATLQADLGATEEKYAVLHQQYQLMSRIRQLNESYKEKISTLEENHFKVVERNLSLEATVQDSLKDRDRLQKEINMASQTICELEAKIAILELEQSPARPSFAEESNKAIADQLVFQLKDQILILAGKVSLSEEKLAESKAELIASQRANSDLTEKLGEKVDSRGQYILLDADLNC